MLGRVFWNVTALGSVLFCSMKPGEWLIVLEMLTPNLFWDFLWPSCRLVHWESIGTFKCLPFACHCMWETKKSPHFKIPFFNSYFKHQQLHPLNLPKAVHVLLSFWWWVIPWEICCRDPVVSWTQAETFPPFSGSSRASIFPFLQEDSIPWDWFLSPTPSAQMTPLP